MTGWPTYAYSMTIRRNPYRLKINPTKSSECLGTAKQFLEWHCYEGDDGKHPVHIKVDGTKQLRTPWNSPGEDHLPEEQVSTRTRQTSALEEAERSGGGIHTLQ